MANRSNLLLIRSKPNAEESLMGYIIRLTEQNGYESPAWIMQMAGLDCRNLAHSCSVSFKVPGTLEPLATLTGNNIYGWSSLVYPPDECKSYHHHQFSGIPVHRNLVRPNRPKICPKCLNESAYYRRVWDLVLVTVCPIHRCMLIDECPNCKRHIKWARNSVTTCDCQFDWRNSSALLVRGQEVELARHIYYKVGLFRDVGSSCLPEKNPAFGLALQDFIPLIVFVAGQFRGILSTCGYHIERINNNKELHALFTDAFSVLAGWPDQFYKFMDWIIAQERDIPPTRQRLKSVLYRDFGKFYVGLYSKLQAPQFNFMREAFVEYLVERWEGRNLSSLNKEGSKNHLQSGKYISKVDARRLLGIDDRQIEHLIEIGKLKTEIRSKGKKRLIFMDMKDIAKLTREES